MLSTEVATYQKVDQNILDELKSVLGTQNVIVDKAKVQEYSEDATEMCRVGKYGDVVVIPGNTEEIAAVVKIANQYRIPVIARGGATNLAGALVPLYGGIVISFEKLNKIIEIDQENHIAIVETGVITGYLQDEVEKLGLFYPPDPGSMRDCTIGGNIAQSASGPKALKYGGTKDYVLGLEVVLPNGEIIQTGGKTVKNVTGYNLTQLMVGSEGTLGLVTKAILKLIPAPQARKTFLAYFDSIEAASVTITKILNSKILPSTIELMDRNTLLTIEKKHPTGLPTDKEAALLIEIDGHPAAMESEADAIQTICKEMGASNFQVSASREQAQELWFARRSAYHALNFLKPNVISSDAVVPRSKIPQMVVKIREIAKKHDLILGIVGHAGDGNIHPHFAIDIRDQAEKQRLETALGEIYVAAKSFGGILSGEHGIGMEKKQYLEMFLSKAQVDTMKAIKAVLDPQGILNPGKIFL